MDSSDRYERQRRLPEVGEQGQARLAEASLLVGAGDAALPELVYLHRAGVEHVLVSSMQVSEPFAHAHHFAFAESRRLAAGAWRALRKITAVLGK